MLSNKNQFVKNIIKALFASGAVVATLACTGQTKIHASQIQYNVQPRISRRAHSVAQPGYGYIYTPGMHRRASHHMHGYARSAYYMPRVQTKRKAAGISSEKSLGFDPNNYSSHGYRRHRHHVQRRSFKRMYHIAKRHLGEPYTWGAVGPHTFDCSGFTQYLYRKGAHKYIPRTADAQYEYGRPETETHAKRGDLVFFNNLSHVGMYIGHGKMIDAQNRGVIIEKIHEPWWNLYGFARM